MDVRETLSVTHHGAARSNRSLSVQVLAFLRFTVVEIVYGLFLVRTPWFSGGMTGLTCCILLTKCFLFNFHRQGMTITGLVYTVLITPLILTWVETTFLICRVIPQEKAALHVASCLRLDDVAEVRSLLGGPLSGRRGLSRYSPSAGYFTPQGSLFGEDVARLNVPVKGTREAAVDISALLNRASLLCSELWYLYGLEVWGPDSLSGCDLAVQSSSIRDYGPKVFRTEALLDAPAHKVYHDLVYNVRESSSWNRTVDFIETIQSLPSENIDIIYNVIREALGGAICRRDMVLLRTWGEKDDLFYVGSTSVDHPKCPPAENCVRAQQLINAWVIEPIRGDSTRSKVVWIMCNDLKLFMPQRFIERALNIEIPKVLRSLQERAIYLRNTPDPPHPLESQFAVGTVRISTSTAPSSGLYAASAEPISLAQWDEETKVLPSV
ncbi:Steroidogenic acute regulatory protein mitochondrial [Fasciolopsis buskii]|uniref:Steroidogenic acute regulatory protein mitochondrial n=1 Tax=Fasciolopsis buskii TaxID=27845 RepID=A0A8E0S1U7_9TREM|nr:Steroidogenic acute regulatory protein mitochondrial [Fasciolopsis buski]